MQFRSKRVNMESEVTSESVAPTSEGDSDFSPTILLVENVMQVHGGNLYRHSPSHIRAEIMSRGPSLKGRNFSVLNFWSRTALKPVLIPGGILLALAALLLQGGLFSISQAAVSFYYGAVFIVGVLLAWRFHSGRVFFTLASLLLAHRSIEFFCNGQIAASGPGRIAVEAVTLLLPINFIILACIRERGFSLPALTPPLGLLFCESIFIAVICRPGANTGPAFLHPALLGGDHSAAIPKLALLTFAGAFTTLLMRIFRYCKPIDGGLFWSLAAAFLSFQAGAVTRTAVGYLSTAGLILIAAIVENSYFLAYHDELTSLPGRRAFNEAISQLEAPYSIATVDIDHFKKFNDTYGHEIGDHVLRMVAARLDRVTGGGQAYRVGGEEFTILFPGKALAEVVPHLELLRAVIESSSFHVRGGQERRKAPRGPDRRSTRKAAARTRSLRGNAAASGSSRDLHVTVSIGVAEPNATAEDIEQVIKTADQALYRAKQRGRNRLEAATGLRGRRATLAAKSGLT
jgi:diguanylate cyclase (GGDEF)-like protein